MKRIVIGLIIVAWLVVPTGTPDDFFTLWLIGLLGPYAYVILLSVLLFFLWKYKVNFKMVKKTMKSLLKKVLK